MHSTGTAAHAHRAPPQHHKHSMHYNAVQETNLHSDPVASPNGGGACHPCVCVMDTHFASCK